MSPSRSSRYATWFFVVLGAIMLIPAIRGVRGRIDPRVGLLSVLGFLICLCLAALIALAARRKALEDRGRQAAGTMLVTMAAMLNRESDETLEKIATKGGPGGEAATLLLENRKNKR